MRTKILMIAVLLGLTTTVMAQPKSNEQERPFHGQNREMKMGPWKGARENGLNLSDAQKDAFKQSRMAMQKQLQPLQNELGEAEAHQKTLMSAGNPDLAAINKNIEKIGSLRVEMAKIKAKNRLDMRAQLTDEQRLKLDFMKAHFKKGEGIKNPREMRGRMRPDLN